MRFTGQFSEFAAIERHIKAARIQRAVAISQMIAEAIAAAIRGLKKIGTFVGRNLAAERDRRAIEADPFLKRSVPKY